MSFPLCLYDRLKPHLWALQRRLGLANTSTHARQQQRLGRMVGGADRCRRSQRWAGRRAAAGGLRVRPVFALALRL